ncbi:MAG TPA: MFS transporter [Dehalococcoidia bacterium]|nr:MFS transporter [Dehalococcoidia bacterium]
MAQNSLLYALLIHVVEETGSSIQSTLLVVVYTAPSILLGIPAGVLAEVLPRRLLLTVGYLVRAATVLGMIYYNDSLDMVYLLLMVFASAGQFMGPAESAALPKLVRPSQLTAANSVLVFTVMLGQVVGAVILAPFLLKVFGVQAVQAVVVVLLLYAALVVIAMPRAVLDTPPPPSNLPPIGLDGAIIEGWRILRSSRRAFMAVVYLTMASILAKAVAVLAPHYTKDVLGIATENAVYIMAPAAIGALIALPLTPALARLFGASRIAVFGFLLFVAATMGLGFVVYIRDFMLDNVDLGISFVEERLGVSSVITMAMLLAIPAGLAMTMVMIAARAVLNHEAPQGTQARVFATQSALSDAAALPPLFIIGGVAELVGVRAVLLVAAISALAGTAYISSSRRFQPPPPTPLASTAGPGS